MEYYFIVNLTSRTGKAQKIWHMLKAELNRRDVSYKVFITRYGDHAKSLARKICRRADENACLVVVGGDGTVNEAINGMDGYFDKIRFGYIATGSGNDLGRGLGIPGNPIKALDCVLAERKPYLMDLGYVRWAKDEGRYFAISSGTGLDAMVCKLVSKSKLKVLLNYMHLGKFSYLLLTLKGLAIRPTTDGEAIIDGKTKKEIKHMTAIAVMNQKKEGGGVPMAPKADNQDGKLSVCFIMGMSRPKAFLLLPFLATGHHDGVAGMEVIDCHSWEIRLNKPMPIHTDGEYKGDKRSLSYACLPKKLRIQK